MPGTIRITVMELVDLPGPGGRKYCIEVALGDNRDKTAPLTASASAAHPGTASTKPYNSDFVFTNFSLKDVVEFALLDARGVSVGAAKVPVPGIVSKGLRNEFLPLSNGGRIHVVSSFALSDAERAKIAALRESSRQRRMAGDSEGYASSKAESSSARGAYRRRTRGGVAASYDSENDSAVGQRHRRSRQSRPATSHVDDGLDDAACEKAGSAQHFEAVGTGGEEHSLGRAERLQGATASSAAEETDSATSPHVKEISNGLSRPGGNDPAVSSSAGWSDESARSSADAPAASGPFMARLGSVSARVAELEEALQGIATHESRKALTPAAALEEAAADVASGQASRAVPLSTGDAGATSSQDLEPAGDVLHSRSSPGKAGTVEAAIGPELGLASEPTILVASDVDADDVHKANGTAGVRASGNSAGASHDMDADGLEASASALEAAAADSVECAPAGLLQAACAGALEATPATAVDCEAAESLGPSSVLASDLLLHEDRSSGLASQAEHEQTELTDAVDGGFEQPGAVEEQTMVAFKDEMLSTMLDAQPGAFEGQTMIAFNDEVLSTTLNAHHGGLGERAMMEPQDSDRGADVAALNQGLESEGGEGAGDPDTQALGSAPLWEGAEAVEATEQEIGEVLGRTQVQDGTGPIDAAEQENGHSSSADSQSGMLSPGCIEEPHRSEEVCVTEMMGQTVASTDGTQEDSGVDTGEAGQARDSAVEEMGHEGGECRFDEALQTSGKTKKGKNPAGMVLQVIGATILTATLVALWPRGSSRGQPMPSTGVPRAGRSEEASGSARAVEASSSESHGRYGLGSQARRDGLGFSAVHTK